MRGVKKATAKGHVYYYHRATGERIKEPFGTAAFLARVEALDSKIPAPPMPGTLGALVKAWQASPEFRNGLAERTQADYVWVMDRHAALEPVGVTDVDGFYLLAVRNKAFEKHGWRFANYTVDVFRSMFKWGKTYGHCELNPAAEVARLPRPRGMAKKNRAWTDLEVSTVLERCQGGIRAAVALAVYTGMRQGDALRLTWAARKSGWITWQQGKTGDEVSVPEHRALTAILNAAKKDGIHVVAREQRNVFRKNKGPRSSDYSSMGFRASFFRIIRELREAGTIGDGLTFHGLRVTAATNLADAGCDPKTIAAITGHRTSSMVEHYTQGADRRARAKAGIIRLERSQNRKRKTGTDGRGKPS